MTYDALIETEVTICSEIKLEIAQHLMSRTGRVEDIQKVASHPQPLAQCRRWMEQNLHGIESIETTSMAAAAQLAHADEKVASIGSEVTAEVYDLLTVASRIEDQRGTRRAFLVIGRETPAPSGQDLTSAVFTVRRDQSGALHDLLGPFAKHGVNLTAVQSRPMKGKPWEYIFIVDMEGHQDDAAVAAALAEAGGVAASHKVLGSFPRALEVSSGVGRTVAAPAEESARERSRPRQAAHSRSRPLQAGQADGGARTRAWDQRLHQARVEREPPRPEPEGRRSDSRGGRPDPPISGRRELQAP